MNQMQLVRKALDLTVAEWASFLGVDKRSIENWESGEAKPSSSADRVATGIAEALEKHKLDVKRMVRRSLRVGGISYLLVVLFEDHAGFAEACGMMED